MPTTRPGLRNVYPGPAGDTACPRCHSVAYRVPRRWIDRLTSLLRPVWRYSCQNINCRTRFNRPAGR